MLTNRALWSAAAVSLSACGVWGQCEPAWSEVFTPGEFDGGLFGAVILGSDSGERLVVNGAFRGFDGLRGTALRAWEGAGWSFLGEFPYSFTTPFMALNATSQGSASRLLATRAGLYMYGEIVVHAYQSGQWTEISLGADRSRIGSILHGPSFAPSEIYLCGQFDLGDDHPTSTVMRWDGEEWTPLDRSDAPPVSRPMVWFDDGSGEALYVSVSSQIDGVPVEGVARWDGQVWTEVGGGCPAYWPSLTLHDDGTGTALWGIGSDMLVKWDGSAWSSLDIDPIEGTVFAFCSADLGDGPELLWSESDGILTSRIWRWNGGDPRQIGGEISGRVHQLLPDESGSFGGGVVVVGGFREVGGMPACYVAGLDADGWHAVGGDRVGNGANPDAMVWVGREGGDALGERLFVSANYAGGRWVHGAATWDGSAWAGIGTLEATPYPGALVAGDLGTGPRVFTWNGAEAVAWDGADWSVLGAAEIGGIPTLAFGAIEGREAMVYLGGAFETIDGVPYESIAALDLRGWHRVGGGLPSSSETTRVWTLGFHDDGSGMALYASGWFHDLYPSLRDGIVRWDGVAYTRVGPAMFQTYENAAAFCSADLGEGPRLFAGGNFDGIDGDLGNIIVWDGETWARVGDGLPPVYALARVEIGGAPSIAAAVWAPNDGQTHERVYLWDGVAWSPFGAVANGSVEAIVQAPEDRGAIYLTGDFTEMASVPSEGIARFGCEPCEADFNGDGWTDSRDLIAFLNAWASGDGSADTDGNGVVDSRDVIAFLNIWNAGC